MTPVCNLRKAGPPNAKALGRSGWWIERGGRVMAKVDDAWAVIRRIIDEPAKDWDFKTDKEKWEWIAERYKEFHEAQEKMKAD